MMKKWVLYMLIFVATANFTMVQSQHVCGTIDQTAILERTKMNKRALALHPELRNGEVLYVPLQFHIVTLNDGTGAIGEEIETIAKRLQAVDGPKTQTVVEELLKALRTE